MPPTTHSRDPHTMSSEERLDEAVSILARGLVRYLDAVENNKTSTGKPEKHPLESPL